MANERFQKFFDKMKDKMKELFHDFVDWFQEEIKPEVMDFANDNKEIFIKIIKDVAVELAGSKGKDKRERATELLRDEFKDTEGKLTVESWWIDTALQMVYAVLRSKNEVD